MSKIKGEKEKEKERDRDSERKKEREREKTINFSCTISIRFDLIELVTGESNRPTIAPENGPHFIRICHAYKNKWNLLCQLLPLTHFSYIFIFIEHFYWIALHFVLA